MSRGGGNDLIDLLLASSTGRAKIKVLWTHRPDAWAELSGGSPSQDFCPLSLRLFVMYKSDRICGKHIARESSEPV